MSINSYQHTVKPHVSLNVANVDRSVHFYERVFGRAPRKHYHDRDTMHSVLLDDAGAHSLVERTGYAKFDLQQPNLNLVLNEVRTSTGGALSHLGVQLDSTEAVLALKEALVARGLNPRDEMQVKCCYARQDKFWLADPDGNEWEFFVVLEDLPSQSESQCGCATSKNHDLGPMKLA